MVILFITGELRSGKDTAAEYLKNVLIKNNIHVETMAFSDPVRISLHAFGLPPERENYSSMCTAMKSAFGPNVLIRAITQHLVRLRGLKGVLILTGGRFLRDLDVLKGFSSLTVAITASENVRFERSKNSPKDSCHTLAQFREANAALTEGEIQLLKRMCNTVLENNSNLSDFHAQLTGVVDCVIKLSALE